MVYSPETYAAAALWTEDTVITYVPFAKKAGTKSAVRYDIYSKATTIGEAKRLGSDRQDLLHDYEKKFFRVSAAGQQPETGVPRVRAAAEEVKTVGEEQKAAVAAPAAERAERPSKKGEKALRQEGESGNRAGAGGRAAEKPEKKEEAQKDEGMTQLRKEKRQHMHNLMAALGLDFQLARDLKAAADNHEMMAERLMADRMGQLVLEAAEEQGRRITDREVLAVLKLWHFKKNEARQNVLPDGQKWVHSDTFGLVRSRTGAWCVTSATQEYPHVTRVLNTWFKARCPEELEGTEFPCTSISLNSNYAAKRHRDGNNAGPSMIRGFGNYTGGELAYWPDDDRSGPVEDLYHDDRKVMNISNGLVLFDGCRGHEVDDFKGERFSVVWFNAGKYWTMGKENKEFLQECGFGATETQELGPVMKLLPAPRGYTRCKSLSSMFGAAEKPQVAKVNQWADGTDAREEEQAERLLSGLTAELEAFVRAKELVDAEAHARNILDEANENENEKENEKPGALDALFSRAAADRGKVPAPASPPPAPRSTGGRLLGAELSGEKRRAPSHPALADTAEDTPPSKRSRLGEDAAGRGAALPQALDLLSEGFQPELKANHEEFRRGEFRSFARALEEGSGVALANYFRLVLHSAEDPRGHLCAALALLAPALRLPRRVLRLAVAQLLGRSVSPEEGLVRAVLAGKSAQVTRWGRSPLTVFEAAEVLRAASDALAHAGGGSAEGVAQAEAQAVGGLAELLAVAKADGNAQVAVALLLGDGPMSRSSALEALGHAFALTRPPAPPRGGPAEARKFASSEARRAYVTAMGKVVPQAFGNLGGSCEELLAAVMEDVSPAWLLARCGPRGGTPILPMEATQSSDADEAVSRLAGLEVAVELRYTGRRVQIHRLGDCIAIFGPEQQDLGASLGKGQLGALRAALASRACVLDAVAVCSGGEGSEEVRFMAFDCLLLEGRSLAGQGLSARHEALRRAVLPCEFLEVAQQERFTAESPLEVESVAALLVEAEASSCSGLILKSLAGTYEAGRTAESWVALMAAHH